MLTVSDDFFLKNPQKLYKHFLGSSKTEVTNQFLCTIYPSWKPHGGGLPMSQHPTSIKIRKHDKIGKNPKIESPDLEISSSNFM